jgi:hypothetical protein
VKYAEKMQYIQQSAMKKWKIKLLHQTVFLLHLSGLP